MLSENDSMELFNMMKDGQERLKDSFVRLTEAVLNSPFEIDQIEKYLCLEYLNFCCNKMPKYRYVFEACKKVNSENFGNISYIKEKIPQVNHNVHDKINRKFLYVYAIYNIFDITHTKFLYPIGWIYCKCVYFFKVLQFKIMRIF